jgi:hypothetical protein
MLGLGFAHHGSPEQTDCGSHLSFRPFRVSLCGLGASCPNVLLNIGIVDQILHGALASVGPIIPQIPRWRTGEGVTGGFAVWGKPERGAHSGGTGCRYYGNVKHLGSPPMSASAVEGASRCPGLTLPPSQNAPGPNVSVSRRGHKTGQKRLLRLPGGQSSFA